MAGRLTITSLTTTVPGLSAGVNGFYIGQNAGQGTSASDASATLHVSGTVMFTSATLIGGPHVSNTGYFFVVKQPTDTFNGGIMLERPGGGATPNGQIAVDANGLNFQSAGSSLNKVTVSANGIGVGGIIPNGLAKMEVSGTVSVTAVKPSASYNSVAACTVGEIRNSVTYKSTARCESATGWRVMTSSTVIVTNTDL